MGNGMTQDVTQDVTQGAKRRANSVATFTDMDGIMTWDYGPAYGKVIVDSAKGSAAARAWIYRYGLKQWHQDGAAVMAGENGKVDPQAKFDGMWERAELFMSGADALTMRRGKSEDVTSGILLLEGMARGLGRDAKGVEALLEATMDRKGMDRKAALEMWAKTDKVITGVSAVKAERAAKRVTTAPKAEDLEAEMMGAV